MVSFTGSTAVGAAIGAAAGGALKRVALELGGKSANVILPGADLARAVKVGVANAFLNSGQTCSAWTRMLVHDGRLRRGGRARRRRGREVLVGDPFDAATRLGPLVADRQRNRVRGYIATGVDGGRPAGRGRRRRARRPDRATSCAPRVFADVDAGHDDRAGGDLRPGAVDHAVPRRGRGRGDRQRHRATGWPAAVWAADDETASRSPPGWAPGRSTSTAARSTRGAVRRVQVVRRRPGAGAARARGVPPDQSQQF